MRRRKHSGSYVVTGPDVDRQVLSVAHGIVLAQEYACRRKDQATFYVRDLLDTTTYATVTREEDGTVLTTPAIAA